MKHSFKITGIILAMFFLTQLIGLVVIYSYSPQIKQIQNEQGELVNVTTYNLPFGTNPPEDIQPQGIWSAVLFLAIAFAIAIFIMLIMMKYHAEIFIKLKNISCKNSCLRIFV